MERLVKFREDRQWEKYHTPKNLAMAIAGEVGELIDLYLWDREPKLMNVSWEIADIFIYLLNLCEILQLDPVSIIEEKIRRNEINYPVKKYCGNGNKKKTTIPHDIPTESGNCDENK